MIKFIVLRINIFFLFQSLSSNFSLKQFQSKYDNSKELFVIPSRYYHNVAEHDISEPLSEEDFVRTSMKTSKRQPSDYYWVPRNEPDRYENVTPLMRRARTKPDMDRLMDSEMNKARRCNRCGNLSNKKNEPPVKSTCRFDDSANIPIKGSIGEILYTAFINLSLFLEKIILHFIFHVKIIILKFNSTTILLRWK